MSGEGGIEAAVRVAYPGFSLAVDLDLPGRGVSALFGASGSGKTTCLRCIAGLEPLAEGRIAVGGELWQDTAAGRRVPTHKRALGMVFQDGRLFPHLSVRANLGYGMKRIPQGARRVALDDVVDLLAIGNLLERRPEGLSGGEQQRVAIARALLASPRLLLLDEPLAALDEARKAEVLPYLERLHDELQIPVIYVSHAMREVARLADHLVLLERGRVVASGPIAQMTARLDLPLAQEDGAAVVLDGHVVEHDAADGLTRVASGAGSLWVAALDRAAGRPVRLEIAARDVSIALAPPNASSILNILPAVVAVRADDDRGRSLLQLEVGEAHLLSRVTRRSANALGLQPGQRVFAQVKGVAVLG
ncbi:MAG TPA: molybdenum ABC transporter ATP-binding protein [Burkholderiaceae bacterium]